MNPAPMSNNSLKTVLQYMDANKRFEVSKRIPSTQAADRLTPLFIAKLAFNGYTLTINNVKYTFRICAKNHLYWNDIYLEYKLETQLFPWDLDQFGLEDVSTESMIWYGDLRNEWRRRVQTNNEVREDREGRIRMLEVQLGNARNELDRVRENSERFDFFKRKVEKAEAELIPYHCFRDNRPLPYDINPYIQYCQSTSTHVKACERISYNWKLPQAMKYLTTKIFANREHPIKVRRLLNQNYETIRLPVNLKMEVRELHVAKIVQAKQLLPVIHNYRCETFRLDSPHELDFGKEILKIARSLIIVCSAFPNWLEHALKLQHRKVLLMGTDIDRFPNNYTLLMKNWIEKGREVGTSFSFGLRKSAAEKVKSMVEEQFGGLEIKMNNENRLVVSIEEMYFEEEEGVFDKLWKFNMEVADKYIDCF